MSEQPYRLPRGGRIDRARTHLIHVRRPHARRPSRRHARLGAARQWRAHGRALVQVSSAARHLRGGQRRIRRRWCSSAAIRARTDPNTRVTEQEVHDGLIAHPQNCWPSLKFDVGALNDFIAPFIPAGFYYKTFKGWPAAGCAFEPLIRRAAGLGRAPDRPDPDRYEAVNRHCDVLVVGGGPAGLMAALAAGRSGARVILAEETPELGGTLLSRDPEMLSLDGKPRRPTGSPRFAPSSPRCRK